MQWRAWEASGAAGSGVQGDACALAVYVGGEGGCHVLEALLCEEATRALAEAAEKFAEAMRGSRRGERLNPGTGAERVAERARSGWFAVMEVLLEAVGGAGGTVEGEKLFSWSSPTKVEALVSCLGKGSGATGGREDGMDRGMAEFQSIAQ